MAGDAHTRGSRDSVVGVICARDEERNIARAVRTFRSIPRLSEVVVVDGGSTDATVRQAEAAGARVVPQCEERYPGKGLAVQTGVQETDEDVIVFFDADIHNIARWQVEALVDAVVDADVDHAIARFTRKAGRVTELTAKPLLRLLFPEVRLAQPLAGEFATRRSVIERVDLVPDWGIESGLVIDLHMMGAHVREVDTGHKEHPMKPLGELGMMADQVVRTILQKAVVYDRLRPGEVPMADVVRLDEAEVLRPATSLSV